MSAFEKAFNALRGVVGDEEADRLLVSVGTEHAHELAEKIRDHPGPHADDFHPDSPGFWWDTRDRDAAADLIDPNVSDD